MRSFERRLRSLRGAIRTLFALDGASRLVLAAAGFAALTFALDWTFLLPAAVRLVLLGLGLALLAWVAVRRVLYPLSVRVTDDDLAVFVERHYPELNDRLISAIQLAREPVSDPSAEACFNSPELVEALVSDAERATAALDFRRAIVRRHVGRVALAAAGVAAVLAVGAVLEPVYAATYLNRILGGSAKWPRRTELVVLDFPGKCRVVPKGDDLVIAVLSKRLKPSKVVLDYRYRTGERGRERMTDVSTPDGDRFHFTFARVTAPFEFTVSGGDDVTDVHGVETLPPPSVEAVHVFYEYPAYLRKPNTPPDQPEMSGNIVAPFHTKVRFEAFATEVLETAAFTLGTKGKERTSPLEVLSDAQGNSRKVSGSFEVAEPASEYAIHLKARNGLANRDPIRFTIKGVKDMEPQPSVKDPLGDEFITELCARPLEVEWKDDYGIRESALVYRVVAQDKAKSRDWTMVVFTREHNSREYGDPAIRSRYVLDVGSMGLQVGDHVELKFRAEDYKDIGPRNAKESRTYKLSIVALGVLEKELQDAIEKIKQLLKNQKAREEGAWDRTGRLIQKFGALDLLSREQQGEVRQAAFEQGDVASKLDTASRDIRHIMRRGVYNKIYNEAAASKLQGAIDELDALVGDPGDPTRPGPSRVAAAAIDQSAKLKSGADRAASLREAQNLQSSVASGIQKAIDYLEKWSSYQEVVRIVREILEMQRQVNRRIKGK